MSDWTNRARLWVVSSGQQKSCLARHDLRRTDISSDKFSFGMMKKNDDCIQKGSTGFCQVAEQAGMATVLLQGDPVWEKTSINLRTLNTCTAKSKRFFKNDAIFDCWSGVSLGAVDHGTM
jgi:hypothetical protein